MPTERRVIVAVWVGLGVWLAGRLVDVRWHATHDEFEGVSQQLEAHWLAWLGVVLTFAAATVAARTSQILRRSWALRSLIAATAVYVVVAVWHFIEHATGADPPVAHVFLVIANIGMVGAASALTYRVASHRSSPDTGPA